MGDIKKTKYTSYRPKCGYVAAASTAIFVRHPSNLGVEGEGLWAHVIRLEDELCMLFLSAICFSNSSNSEENVKIDAEKARAAVQVTA